MEPPPEARDNHPVVTPEWESYPNYAARYVILLALRNEWPEFWQSLNAGWRSGEPGWLDRWTREYNVMNEEKGISNHWLRDVVTSTLEYWSGSPDSPDAVLQPDCPWFRYPADQFRPFPEFRPVLTDARPILIPRVGDVPGQIAAMQQRPMGDLAAVKAATPDVRGLFTVEPTNDTWRRILKQSKQQWARYCRKYRRNAEFARTIPRIQAHARWSVLRMRGACREAVAEEESKTGLPWEDDGADHLETIERQVRRFMREAELQLPPWARESR